MIHLAKFAWMVVLFAAPTLLPISVFAQNPEPPLAEQIASSGGEEKPITLAEVESALAAIEADAGIEETVKSLLRPKYEQAIEALKEAAPSAAKAAEYRESMTQAPGSAADKRAQLKELPSAENAGDVTAPSSPDDLQQELVAKRAALAALNEQLSGVTADLSRGEQRPAEISVRAPEAERELSDARKQLASPDFAEDITSPSRVADRLLLKARVSKLQGEVEMLKQERLSLSVRRDLQLAQKELLTRQVENASASIAAYEALLNKSVTEEAQDIGTRAEESQSEVPEDDQDAKTLATEVQELANQLQSVIENKQKISAAKVIVTDELNRLTKRYDSISKQLELGQPGGEMAKVLIELRNLINAREREFGQMRQWPTLDQARLAAVQVDFKFDDQSEMQAKFADRSSRAVQDLLVARGEVLDKLQKQYFDLVLVQSSLDSETRKYLDKTKEIRADTWQQLFWLRISPTINASTLRELPGGLQWVFSGAHWSEVGSALRGAARRMPVPSAVIVVFAVGLLLMRPQIAAALRRTGEGVGRVSTDRYALTGRAMLWTALLAVPVPLLLAWVASSLSQADSPSAWLRGINRGMPVAVLVSAAAAMVAACCCSGGLGAVHFRWRAEPLAWLRRGSRWVSIVYVPLELVTCCTVYAATSRYLDNVGRVSLMLAHAWMAIILGQLFYSSSGIHATFVRENPTHRVSRFRYLWSALIVACPVGLFVLAGLGYTITASNLSYQLVVTLIIIASGVLLYELTLRWFRIEHRQLALAKALEKRRARQEAAANEAQQEDSDEVIAIDEEEQGLDLDAVGEQTRQLLWLLFGLGIFTAVISSLSTTLPLIAYLDSVRLPLTGAFSLLELAKAVLIVAVTWIAMQNLPGVLELAVLRATSLDAGTRHAISTICQYAAIATGLFFLFEVLDLDWAKFGWIAGGLSVGIGFGLQEIVANFVCGLILLFERPIRVGDVVTVEGEHGTVTKINIRSTTITNFDRGEVVLPNKTLITSKLVNWTLSASLNRVVIPVGVAYGTNTEKSRQILLGVAADHPNVLDDPAPMAIFDQFADSSLNLALRAYLPDRSNRDATITELHTEIDKRFASAGIEIPFPQRDLHLRNGIQAPLLGGTQSVAEEVEKQEATTGADYSR